MDDLAGLDWSSTPTDQSKKPPMNAPSAFSYPSLQPTPSPLGSGRNTPLSIQGSGNVAAKPPASKPAQDSFSNLMNFGGAPKSNAKLSLKEQQERLDAEKRRKAEEKQKQSQSLYGNGQFLDMLGHRSTGQSRTPSPAIPPPSLSAIGAHSKKPTDSDKDLFAAFNADTKVDRSSHYPPPSQNGSRQATPANATPSVTPGLDLKNPSAWATPSNGLDGGLGDDDDPFGLNKIKTEANPAPQPAADDFDDLLGDLGRPVEEVRREAEARKPKPEPGKPIEDSESESEGEPDRSRSDDPFDKAVVQLMDYGFTQENARRGLTESGAGLNVQAAVNWLLDDAHRQSKEKAQGGRSSAGPGPDRSRTSSQQRGRTDEGSSRRDDRSPASGGEDFTKTAAAMGNSLFKTANSLWKTSQKKVQKAVKDFQQEGDPSQPKWMRDAQQVEMRGGDAPSRSSGTDEAMMLESGMQPPRKQTRPSEPTRNGSSFSSRDQSPANAAARTQRGGSSVPKWQQSSQPLPDPRARLNKLAAQEDSPQVYISPARRKKTTHQPPPEPQQEPDLMFSDGPTAKPSLPQRPAQSQPTSRPSPQPRPAPKPRPAVPARQIPSINSLTLQSSTKHRNEGTAHFKRGDYASAHTSYTASLSGIPPSHPLVIVLLCNRALTALKTGEPRQAVADADTALSVIGPGKGESESVALEDGTGEKRDMKDLYGKALTRKAEALEQMEKWADAGTVWQICVESGVGGPTATAGRQRCQKALAPKAPAPSKSPASRPKAPVRPRPTPSSAAQSSEAVERLRAANAAAEKADGEKLALVDGVDARIAAWRDGKRDNIRALLASLDNVLWATSGWKKVGLHELVMANKVKIIYMKAIAKTHPDKLPQDASTEVRMIAGSVFATLNESWDKFKAENGL